MFVRSFRRPAPFALHALCTFSDELLWHVTCSSCWFYRLCFMPALVPSRYGGGHSLFLLDVMAPDVCAIV